MGMRGEGDAESPTLTPEALEDIIEVQQSILNGVLGADNASSIPQTWVLYKVSLRVPVSSGILRIEILIILLGSWPLLPGRHESPR